MDLLKKYLQFEEEAKKAEAQIKKLVNLKTKKIFRINSNFNLDFDRKVSDESALYAVSIYNGKHLAAKIMKDKKLIASTKKDLNEFLKSWNHDKHIYSVRERLEYLYEKMMDYKSMFSDEEKREFFIIKESENKKIGDE